MSSPYKTIVQAFKGMKLSMSIRSLSVLLQLVPFQKDKVKSLVNLEAFADGNYNVAQIQIFVFDRRENIVGKGENADYQHFLLFPQFFQKTYLPQSR